MGSKRIGVSPRRSDVTFPEGEVGKCRHWKAGKAGVIRILLIVTMWLSVVPLGNSQLIKGWYTYYVLDFIKVLCLIVCIDYFY